MLLNYLKGFLVKKRIKNSLLTERTIPSSKEIKTVGLLIDENYFSEKKELIDQIVSNGILREDIQVIVFKNRLSKSNSRDYPVFTPKSLNWKATIDNTAVTEFVNREFDLLISYYDVEKAILLLVTHLSKADFKAGFASIDKRLNDLMINSTAENHKVFVHELFRYLKILNKI
ncbi:DUF6913 domain-containing protein [Flavobacterium sp. UMI-01]|uniref:DUF6913 domain-containing protein n=1 Tax=Flavobacterium sp. UMI-01 TaxID=1441053 RepID=UPI001C7DCB93|nr:hypothetical protein [Flavobacterium sp. UMI-01]GIZ07653.1 hypothetical protein FUMI01_03800 [Flavobacterium sp. UMI-01]